MSKVLKKYAKGNLDADLKVISLGLGVQSTAVYLMSSMGHKLSRADYAIFADTGGEYKKTLKLLEWLLKWKEHNNGIPIIVNRDKNLLNDIKKSYKHNTRVASIPAYPESGGIIMRQCTYDYKISPVMKTIRKLHGLKPRQRMKPTEVWLGISTDEIERMKESGLYNIDYFYPLIYHSMSRTDCINFFKENNFPIPIKSGCVFCPYHNNKEWAKQKKYNYDEFKIAVDVDKMIRNNLIKKDKSDKLYISSQRKPLDEIDFEDKQLPIFDDFDCEGHCGL